MTTLAASATEDQSRRLTIGFNNFAHAVAHYVMLIFPTVVIGLEVVYGRPYGELLALGTASFFAFGIFSLPAGWLADRWSRRYMMVVFYIGCGLSCAAAALSPNFIALATSLFALGVFASIYHPVGTAIVVAATNRGRTLAFNGVCGNIGVSLAAGITAALTAWIGWRGAFMVPAVVCVATGIAYLVMVPDDRKLASGRSAAPDVRLAMWMMITVFGLFILIGTTAGLVFNTMTIALPKLIDERMGGGISLVAVGGIATAVFLCGAVAQLAVGRIIERYPAHLVFAFTGVMQFVGVVWVVYATGYALLGALAFAIAFVYAQVTVNDFVIARYTADKWRARVYAVRYFITYVISGAAISMIAFLHNRGGFDLVLVVTAVIATGFLVGTAGVAFLVNGVERESREAVQPAE